MIKNSGAGVSRGDFDGHLRDDWRTAHKTFEGVKGGGYVVDQEAWIAPTLQNSWINYDASYFNPAGYFKDTMGIVHLRGVVKNGTLSAAIFTLPAGYRPARMEMFAVPSGGMAICEVSAAGEVLPLTATSDYFSMDGITFRAA